MRHLPITLCVPLLTVLACGTDHHSVARVDEAAGTSGATALEPGSLVGLSSAGAPPTTSTGGSGNSASGSTGGQSNGDAGASAGGVGVAGAGTSTKPTGGASSGGKASGGVSAAAGTGSTDGGLPATGGGGTSTGGASAGGAGGAGTTGGTSGEGQAGNAGAGTCPAELPLLEDSCSPGGLSCHYTGCTATRDYCSATAACQSGTWEIGYTDCECPGTGGAAGAGGSPGGGSAGQGGAASGCEFTYTTPVVTSGTCRIASGSQNSCGEAAQCICADENDVETCVAYLTVPRGGPTFSDYCGPTSTRSLADALQALAPSYQGTATVSEGCSDIPATLDF
ncbi:MAG: hypothetical protein JW940_30890 [Polyangiaceae bacterium]|nr:hypothetical protein [Polyangiaceae bacterium]